MGSSRRSAIAREASIERERERVASNRERERTIDRGALLYGLMMGLSPPPPPPPAVCGAMPKGRFLGLTLPLTALT